MSINGAFLGVVSGLKILEPLQPFKGIPVEGTLPFEEFVESVLFEIRLILKHQGYIFFLLAMVKLLKLLQKRLQDMLTLFLVNL